MVQTITTILLSSMMAIQEMGINILSCIIDRATSQNILILLLSIYLLCTTNLLICDVYKLIAFYKKNYPNSIESKYNLQWAYKIAIVSTDILIIYLINIMSYSSYLPVVFIAIGIFASVLIVENIYFQERYISPENHDIRLK